MRGHGMTSYDHWMTGAAGCGGDIFPEDHTYDAPLSQEQVDAYIRENWQAFDSSERERQIALRGLGCFILFLFAITLWFSTQS